MLKPATPSNEDARLAALRALSILDTAPEERFDVITRTARLVFEVPIALVSLVDANRQWFKSHDGLDAPETPRDVSFCGHAILVDDVFVVENAQVDPRFRDNPLVTGKPRVVFYAGMPLSGPNGLKLGTLCLIDHRPRQFDAAARELLRGLAKWAERELSIVNLVGAAAKQEESRLYLETVLNNIVDGIVTITEAGIVESMNPAAVHIFGYKAAEVLGRTVTMLMPEPYYSAPERFRVQFLTSGGRDVMAKWREMVGRRKDGSTFPMELSVSEVPLSSGLRFSGIVRDVSARKAVEWRLYESLAMQHAIVNAAAYTIISTDPSGTIQSVNRAAEVQLGFTAKEVVGQVDPGLFHDPEEVARRAAELTA